MNKRIVSTAITTLLLAGCAVSESDTGPGVTRLPPCTEEDTLFDGLAVDALPEMYHSTVSRIIDEHVSTLGTLTSTPLQCTAETFREMSEPSAGLLALAQELPEFGPSRIDDLSEVDLGPVLLEHLRVYECTLLERGQFLQLFVIDEIGEDISEDGGPSVRIVHRDDLTVEQTRQANVLTHELTVSRPTLDRTLSLVGGFDKLRPLAAELECLKRASLDLRNVLGLTAEAMSCMPKIWDARGSLRDLPSQQ